MTGYVLSKLFLDIICRRYVRLLDPMLTTVRLL